jgi:hypothetical protein
MINAAIRATKRPSKKSRDRLSSSTFILLKNQSPLMDAGY